MNTSNPMKLALTAMILLGLTATASAQAPKRKYDDNGYQFMKIANDR
jgi:hypothetical protein